MGAIVTSYDHPKNIESILQSAGLNMEFRSQTKDGAFSSSAPYQCEILTEAIELIDSYLNGQRTLSNDRLSFLILSSLQTFPLPNGIETENGQDFDLLICAAHFIGDGMALHTFADQFFGLLGGALSENGLRDLLEHEVEQFAKDRKV
jgi:hypothetical protein